MFLTKTKRSPFYQIVYLKDGKQTSKSTQTTDRKKAEIILEAFERSIIKLPEIPFISSSIRLRKFSQEYIELTSLSRSRCYLKRSVEPAFKYLLLYFGNPEIRIINSKHVEKFLLNHFRKSKHNALLFHRVLKAAFTKAIKWGYIEINPFNDFKLPKIQYKTPKFINQEELRLIIESTDRKILRYIFAFAFYTGLRLSEIINLKWEDVNLFDQIIQVGANGFITKSERSRVIPLAKPALEILIKIKSDHYSNKFDYVFCKNCCSKYSGDYISRQFKKAIRKAGLTEDFKFHSLRASFGSYLLQKGVPISSISKLLGHSSIAVTEKHYASLSLTNLIDAIKVFDAIIN